jgi:hypothetical protein
MNLSQFKPLNLVLDLRRSALQPHIRERNPVVKQDPTVFTLWTFGV